MIGVIVGSRKVGINPDNVATPIAASLGDLITLSLLAGVSSTLYEYIGEEARARQRLGVSEKQPPTLKVPPTGSVELPVSWSLAACRPQPSVCTVGGSQTNPVNLHRHRENLRPSSKKGNLWSGV